MAEATLLEEDDASARVETRLVGSLLLAHVVHAAVRAGALTPATPITVVPGPATRSPVDTTHLTVDELLQLLLLTSDRSAAHSLALAVGPGMPAARARMEKAASRLGLDVETSTAAESIADPAYRTSLGDLARLGLAIAREPDLRRRLDLDGVPIADGAFIVRATRPLIATTRGRAASRTALVLERRGDLELLAVAAGADAHATACAALTTALGRYERRVLIRAGQAIGPLVQVRGGIIPRVTAVAAEPFAVTVRRAAPVPIGARLQLPTHVDAPLEVNQDLGELVLERRGAIIGVVPLVAPRAIAPRRWLDATAPTDR